jgi:DNA-directed RNA polymerase subunit RPC12/RpoP
MYICPVCGQRFQEPPATGFCGRCHAKVTIPASASTETTESTQAQNLMQVAIQQVESALHTLESQDVANNNVVNQPG